MVFRYACREFRKYAWMHIAVILQMTVMLLIIISMISTVLSRFRYFSPYEDYISHKGIVGVFQHYRPKTAEDIKESLTNCVDVQLTYCFLGTDAGYKVIVYDDALLARYSPILNQGKLFISEDNSVYAQAIVPISSGYQVGDVINVQAEGTTPNEIRISGVFDDSQKVLNYNPIATQSIADHRLYYAEAYEDGTKQQDDRIHIYLSRSQCAKLSGDMVPDGIGFVVFEDSITAEDSISNQKQLGSMGLRSSFKNGEVFRNGRDYVFEQVYSLLPAVIGISVLLIMSMFSVNAVSTVRQLRTYAVYRVCGLTWEQCGWITVCRAALVSAASIGLCAILLLLRNFVPFGEQIILELGWMQIAFGLAVVLVNLLISISITISIIHHSQPNQLLKAN